MRRRAFPQLRVHFRQRRTTTDDAEPRGLATIVAPSSGCLTTSSSTNPAETYCAADPSRTSRSSWPPSNVEHPSARLTTRPRNARCLPQGIVRSRLERILANTISSRRSAPCRFGAGHPLSALTREFIYVPSSRGQSSAFRASNLATPCRP